MSDLNITCPECHADIALTEQLAGPLVKDLRAGFAKQLAEKEEASTVAIQEAEARAKEAALTEAFKAQEDLKKQVAEQDADLKQLKEAEAKALRREQELIDKEADIEVTVLKKLAAERESMTAKLRVQLTEEAALKVSEKDQVIASMRREIDSLKQKSEQGSMQTQGEAAELVLEDTLGQAFPSDRITPVAKGVSGADALQEVLDGMGQSAGGILWESKRTKNWSPAWLAKLREDQRGAGAEIAVLVSQALPEGVTTFGQVDGVYVCSPRHAVPLAQVLRQGLLEVAKTKGLQVGQQDKKDLIYDYVTGTQFKQRLEAVAERFNLMEEGLRKERQFMEKQWAARHKQIELMESAMLGMHGDFQGIAGRAMPEIDGFDLPLLEDDT
jgi:hypothetical protein